MPQLFATEKAVGYAQVAVERGVDRYPDGLSYAIPQELASLTCGQRVIVPLGRGDTPTAGYVIDTSTTTKLDPENIKFISKLDDAGVQLTGQLLELARWISNYYCSPIGMTLASMLPAAVKKNVGAVRKTMVDLGDPLPLDEKLPAKQKHVLGVLAALSPDQRPIEIRDLAERAELQTIGPIKKLIERKIVEVSRRSVIEAQWSNQAVDQRVPEQLTAEQQSVVQSIGARLSSGFSTHLLFGVTGSGKTEVYIRLIERVVAQGKSALVLVPEISLTPQTGGRLIGRFPKQRVAVLHSGLTSAQRHQQWALASDGSSSGATIVLGARSAVFAPIPDDRLGLIIVDEEHDSSYKQDQSPRYHGRDVAIRRAQLAKCPIVLGSATPSLESWHNATRTDRPTSTLHRLTQRAPGLQLPKVQVLDFRQQSRERKDKHVHLLGPALEAAIGRTLDGNGQALILLNRRGYASYIACPSSHCGWIMTCDHCDVTVVYHRDKKLPLGGYVRCHHCLSEQKLPPTCPQCNKKISIFGLGTQRIEEELTRKFPQLIEGQTLLRIDSDTMGGSRDFHSALSRFGSGEVRVLLGTQMIAKGLDFPGVRLVGVINADTSINLPDFRASERTFQLVNQVAGRCGRGADPGLTIVQTFNPSTPAIRFAADHDFESFAKQELTDREQSGLPPWTRMTRIVVRDEDHVRCISAARELAKRLSLIADQLNGSAQYGRIAESDVVSIRLRGPAPCPIARIADKHRQQIEVLAPTAALMQRFLSQARAADLIKSGEDMAVDVDPTALL
jgi:primosomal protein N' (replication factor Y) (superfamily II helicase)